MSKKNKETKVSLSKGQERESQRPLMTQAQAAVVDYICQQNTKPGLSIAAFTLHFKGHDYVCVYSKETDSNAPGCLIKREIIAFLNESGTYLPKQSERCIELDQHITLAILGGFFEWPDEMKTEQDTTDEGSTMINEQTETLENNIFNPLDLVLKAEPQSFQFHYAGHIYGCVHDKGRVVGFFDSLSTHIALNSPLGNLLLDHVIVHETGDGRLVTGRNPPKTTTKVEHMDEAVEGDRTVLSIALDDNDPDPQGTVEQVIKEHTGDEEVNRDFLDAPVHHVLFHVEGEAYLAEFAGEVGGYVPDSFKYLALFKVSTVGPHILIRHPAAWLRTIAHMEALTHYQNFHGKHRAKNFDWSKVERQNTIRFNNTDNATDNSPYQAVMRYTRDGNKHVGYVDYVVSINGIVLERGEAFNAAINQLEFTERDYNLSEMAEEVKVVPENETKPKEEERTRPVFSVKQMNLVDNYLDTCAAGRDLRPFKIATGDGVYLGLYDHQRAQYGINEKVIVALYGKNGNLSGSYDYLRTLTDMALQVVDKLVNSQPQPQYGAAYANYQPTGRDAPSCHRPIGRRTVKVQPFFNNRMPRYAGYKSPWEFIDMPWSDAVRLMEMPLKNWLYQNGITPERLDNYIKHSVTRYSPIIEEFFHEMSVMTPFGPGIPCNRFKELCANGTTCKFYNGRRLTGMEMFVVQRPGQ